VDQLFLWHVERGVYPGNDSKLEQPQG
jgi:hypothetical protein